MRKKKEPKYMTRPIQAGSGQYYKAGKPGSIPAFTRAPISAKRLCRGPEFVFDSL